MGRMLDYLEQTDQEFHQSSVMELCFGETDDGRHFYAYVNIPLEKYEAFMRCRDAHESISYDEYGQILITGWGKTPDPKVVEYMKTNFNTDLDFSEKLRAAMTAQ